MKRRWHRIKMGWDVMSSVCKTLPNDGEWIVAKDAKGYVEIVRFKKDIFDHFYPHPACITEETITHWRPLRKNFLLYNRV